jgi:hypothetical protein
MKQLSQAGQETRGASYSRMKHATLASVQLLLTGMPDAVEVLGGMSKGRCRRLSHTSHAWHVLPPLLHVKLMMEVIV